MWKRKVFFFIFFIEMVVWLLPCFFDELLPQFLSLYISIPCTSEHSISFYFCFITELKSNCCSCRTSFFFFKCRYLNGLNRRVVVLFQFPLFTQYKHSVLPSYRHRQQRKHANNCTYIHIEFVAKVAICILFSRQKNKKIKKQTICVE